MSSNPGDLTLKGQINKWPHKPLHCLAHSGCDAPVWHSSVVRLGTRAQKVDALARIAASFPMKEPTMLPVYVQATPTIAESHVYNMSPNEYDWVVDIRVYLQMGALLEDPKHAHKIRVQASHFTLIGGDLYRRSFGGPYLRCLIQPEIQYVLSELHEGVCGNHSGVRTLAHRAHSQGYYWPTMRQDTEIYVRKCDKCQKHAPSHICPLRH